MILAAYHHWGPERFVLRLIGMFAFAIVETRPGGRVVLGRDRLGIKPLYLAEVDGRLRFASTLPGPARRRRGRTAVDLTALPPLPQLPLGRARPRDHPPRRAEAAAGDRC